DRAADIVVFIETETEHGAIVFDRRLGFEFLGAGVPAGHHVLAPSLDPFDGLAAFHRQEQNQYDILANQMNLLTEATADVGNDHSNVLQAERFAHAVVNHFRNLRRYPYRQAIARGVIGRDHDKRFERRGAVAVDLEIFLDDPVGGFERGVDVAVLQRPRPGQVSAQFIEQGCRRGLDRLAHVDYRAEWLVVDLDQLERVFRRAAVARRYGADRVNAAPELFHINR